MRKLVVVVLAAAMLSLAGCGDDPDIQQVATGGPFAPKVTIKTLDNVFGGAEQPDIRAAVGEKVEWENLGRNEHDIVPIDSKGWGVDAADFAPGDTYSHTFTEPGVYSYFCSLHGTKTGGMRGRLLVGAVEAEAEAEAEVENTIPKQPTAPSGEVVRVPEDEPTIQKAVDAAGAGDLILVSPGVYEEAVEVPATKSYITIRGVERNTTILDGEFERANGIIVVKAKGVAIENMTARNYTKNGFFWTGADGYRGSYLTAFRNGDYGVYAFESTNGLMEHSYASGSPDAGFYIGGCQPCNARINDVISEWNGLGYSGTNSGGNLVIANSTFRYNRAGIVPNSGSYEPKYPQDENTIVGNLVHGNSNGKTPAIDISITAMGNGILIAGGINNTVERNLVYDHDLGGIVVITFPENAEWLWKATGNRIRDNVVSDSRLGDLGLWFGGRPTETGDNCFEGNTFKTSAPVNLEKQAPCSGRRSGSMEDGALDLFKLASNDGKPASVDYTKAELPDVPEQPNMANPTTAPASMAVGMPGPFDVDAVKLPKRPS